jgi:hypothetical protein
LGFAGIPNAPYNGRIASIRYYRKRLPNAKIQALTQLVSDVDANAYIVSLLSAGATVTPTQQAAINNFYKTGKSDGWYSSLKRLYLPIWAAAAPNAIDMIALGSGTFSGGVTHGSGYVFTDGSTGYFDSNATPSGDGIQLDSASVFLLITGASALAPRAANYGGRPAQTDRWLNAGGSVIGAGGVFTRLIDGSNNVVTKADIRGIILGNRNSNSEYNTHHRTGSGETINNFSTASTTVPTMKMFAMTASLNNTASGFSSNSVFFGAYGHGLGLNSGSGFTIALKNLWEGTTGLTLP